jgi:hypothetical protein
MGNNHGVEDYGQLSLKLTYFALLAASLAMSILYSAKKNTPDKRLFFYTGILLATFICITNLEIIVVGEKFDVEQSAYYNAWAQYAKLIVLLLTPVAGLLYIFFVNTKRQLYRQMVFISSLILLTAIGIATNLGYGAYSKKLILMLFGKEFYPINPYLEWAAYYGTGYVMMMVISFYYLAQKNIISLVPTFLFPIYIIALMIYPNTIADVMFVSIIYIFTSITIFLLVFFKNRFVFLLK